TVMKRWFVITISVVINFVKASIAAAPPNNKHGPEQQKNHPTASTSTAGMIVIANRKTTINGGTKMNQCSFPLKMISSPGVRLSRMKLITTVVSGVISD